MDMLALSAIWVMGGALVGALALAARLAPAAWQASERWSGWWLVAGGALAGLVGGWLGTALLGKFLGSPTAAWLAVLAVVSGPWVAARWPRPRPS